MKTRPPIIAAVDFSSASGQVLAHGAKLAAASGCPLVAVHVIGEGRLRDWAETTGREASGLDRVEELTRRLHELILESCEGVEAEIQVRLGKPQRMLGEIVRELGADLLVIGAHDVSRRRLGSVAAWCARAIPSDVLILRDWQSRFFRKIAAGVDFSKSSAATLDRAISIASAHEASLEIIHVMFPPSRDPWGKVLDQPMDSNVSYETMVRERAGARLDSFLKPYADRLSLIQSSRVFLEAESPAAAIIAHVDALEIDLTVMGSREGSWVADFVLGSNTERLLHDSVSSVLITRE